MIRFCISLVLATLPLAAHAAVALQGEFTLAGPLTHKGATTPGSSHLYFSLTDQAAKTLYDQLAGQPAKDECTGYLVKGQGNIACYEVVQEGRYFCSFSVNLKSGRVEAGLGGCF